MPPGARRQLVPRPIWGVPRELAWLRGSPRRPISIGQISPAKGSCDVGYILFCWPRKTHSSPPIGTTVRSIWTQFAWRGSHRRWCASAPRKDVAGQTPTGLGDTCRTPRHKTLKTQSDQSTGVVGYGGIRHHRLNLGGGGGGKGPSVPPTWIRHPPFIRLSAALAMVATPAANPPPPTDTTIASIPGICSINSAATVPLQWDFLDSDFRIRLSTWPDITSKSSWGSTTRKPRSWLIRSQVVHLTLIGWLETIDWSDPSHLDSMDGAQLISSAP